MNEELTVRQTVKKGKRYIETHLGEKLSTEMIANFLRVSTSTLWRYFKEVGGYTVDQYIRLRRMHMAANNMRRGGKVIEQVSESGFSTLSGFARAFKAVYGITPWEFAKTRGMSLMKEPTVGERPGFYVVGYVFTGITDPKPEDNGAFWVEKEFPEVTAREYARIGGGQDMVGFWTVRDGEPIYILGSPVKRVQYVPENMEQEYIPGGTYAQIPVDGTKDVTVMSENVRVAWYYGLKQWLPDSDYFLDKDRIPYEYYLERENLVCVPLTPKIKPFTETE